MKAAPPNQSIRVGIVGCGAVVQQIHLPCLRNIPNVRISWISDVDHKSGSSLAAAIGVPFCRYEVSMIERPKIDVLLLAIPYGARPVVYSQLSAFGASHPSLYVEKPFARSVEEHRSILATHNDWEVGVGLTRRSMGVVQCARQLARSGIFGEVRYVDVRFGGLGRILTRGGYMSNLQLAGGGMLMEMGVHYIDAALYSSGALDVQFASGRTVYHDGFDVHTDAELSVNGKDGISFPLKLKVTAFESVASGIRLGFESAVVQFDIGGSSRITVKGHVAPTNEFDMSGFETFGPADPHAITAVHWTTFLAARAAKEANYTCAVNAALTTKVIEQIYAQGG